MSLRRRGGMRAAFLAAALCVAGASPIAPALAQIPNEASAPAQSAKGLRPESFTLANGMQVVVIPDHRAPVVTHMVWYRVGSADEARGASGLAHFLEHLMFKGTDKIPPGQFSPIVARNGGVDNAFTNTDYTAYFERVARDRLPLVMEMEADRMRHLKLEEKSVFSERDVIIEERRQRTDNRPGVRLYERMLKALFPSSPYGIPVIGWLHEMQTLTQAQAIDWYRTWYAPNNAILIVAGDIEAAELKPLAEKYYGPLQPTKNLPPRHWTKDAPRETNIRITLSDPKVRAPSFTRLYATTSYAIAKNHEAHALDVAAQVLGGSETSRLYRALVEQQKLAVSASADSDTSGLAGGVLSIAATAAPGVSLEELEKAVDGVLADFLRTGPTPEELERAKTQLYAAAIYARDSQQSLANIYGASLTQGETIDAVYSWPDDIMKVTREQAMAAATNALPPVGYVSGYLLPSGDGEE